MAASPCSTTAKPKWEADVSSKACKVCKTKWAKPLGDRHHCRACGFCVCADCSKGKQFLKTAAGPENLRVCKECDEYITMNPAEYLAAERDKVGNFQMKFSGLKKSLLGKSGPITFYTPGSEDLADLPMQPSTVDQRSSKLWSYLEPFVGQVVFSTTPIDKTVNAESLKAAFTLKDDIYFRAVWPQPIKSYPIGKRGDDPVYGPLCICNGDRENVYTLAMGVLVYVDGELVTGQKASDYQIENSLYYDYYRGPNHSWPKNAADYKPDPEKTDFYAYNVSMRGLIKAEEFNETDSWERAVPKFCRAVASRGVGEHKVDVELRWKIFVDESRVGRLKTYRNAKDKDLLHENGCLVSEPISRGSFTVTVTKEDLADIPSSLPQRASNVPADADAIEESIAAFMRASPEWGARGSQTEQIVKVAIQSGWENAGTQCNHNRGCNCPHWFTVEYRVAVYRNPLNGWEKEEAKTFRLTAATTTKGDLSRFNIWVGGNHFCDVDDIGDEAFAAAGITRCPPELRDGTH